MAHIDDIEFIRKEAHMSIGSPRSALARIAHMTRAMIRGHAKKRSNAITVRHLATLPAYLRRDIGLPDNADIAEVVEHGLARRPAGEEMRRHHTMLPHAV
nr:hypothetical protein [Mesorhizobium sp.]